VTQAWRVVKKKHASTAFDGEGARLFGGRWNHQGVSVVYVSDSLSLAVLEQFIHLGTAGLHLSYIYFEVIIPDDVAVSSIEQKDLPKNWRTEPPPNSTKQIGTEWSQSHESAVLRVPSVIVPHGSNLLLNPNHANFVKLKIGKPVDYSFDPRMWK
jgi:RES domain-containing protein